MAKTRPGLSFAKPKPGKKDLDSYTIRGTNKLVGGTVFYIYIYAYEYVYAVKKIVALVMLKTFSRSFRILAFRVFQYEIFKYVK